MKKDLINLLQPKHPMNDPLVTIITPTWNNQKALRKCIASVRKQTYKYIQHIIVGNGIDFDLHKTLDDLYYFDNYIELGRNWDDITKAWRVGIYAAKGTYVVFLADDETLTKAEIAKLVRTITKVKTDAYKIGIHAIMETEAAAEAI